MMAMKLQELDITVRTANVLDKAGFDSVEQLLKMDGRDLHKFLQTLGKAALSDLLGSFISLHRGRLLVQAYDVERFRNDAAIAQQKIDEIREIIDRE